MSEYALRNSVSWILGQVCCSCRSDCGLLGFQYFGPAQFIGWKFIRDWSHGRRKYFAEHPSDRWNRNRDIDCSRWRQRGQHWLRWGDGHEQFGGPRNWRCHHFDDRDIEFGWHDNNRRNQCRGNNTNRRHDDDGRQQSDGWNRSYGGKQSNGRTAEQRWECCSWWCVANGWLESNRWSSRYWRN